jgi:hypothetical protein
VRIRRESAQLLYPLDFHDFINEAVGDLDCNVIGCGFIEDAGCVAFEKVSLFMKPYGHLIKIVLNHYITFRKNLMA